MRKKQNTKWSEKAQLLQVIGHPVRLLILETLSKKSRCVKDINSIIPLIQPRLSQHMAILKKAKLVACHISGPLRCYYLLRPNMVKNLIKLLYQEHEPKARNRESVIKEIKNNK